MAESRWKTPGGKTPVENLVAIQMFADVARSASFSATARTLHLATSSVTRQIDALEASLGVRLLNRSTRRLGLTEAGRLYLEHAQRILTSVEDGRTAVTELDAEPRGTLRVSAPVVFGRMHIAPRVTDFLAAYPELKLELSLSDQVVDLVEDAVDVAIRIAALPDSSLIARQLVPLKRLICASPAYLRRHGTPVRPEQLAGHACLTFRHNVFGDIWRAGARIWKLGRTGEPTVEVPVAGPLETNNADVLLQAARDGLGLVLIPAWMVSDCFGDCGLVRVLDEYHIGPDDSQPAVYAVYSSARYLSPKIRAFIDFFHGALAGLTEPPTLNDCG
ncbi:MAG: LysR substrate-binding domain-containing protein [Pseudomonadota bacterium]